MNLSCPVFYNSTVLPGVESLVTVNDSYLSAGDYYTICLYIRLLAPTLFQGWKSPCTPFLCSPVLVLTQRNWPDTRNDQQTCTIVPYDSSGV